MSVAFGRASGALSANPLTGDSVVHLLLHGIQYKDRHYNGFELSAFERIRRVPGTIAAGTVWLTDAQGLQHTLTLGTVYNRFTNRLKVLLLLEGDLFPLNGVPAGIVTCLPTVEAVAATIAEATENFVNQILPTEAELAPSAWDVSVDEYSELLHAASIH